MVGHWWEEKFDPRFLTRYTTKSMEWGERTYLRILERHFSKPPVCVFVNVHQITKINKGKGGKRETTYCVNLPWMRKKCFVYIQEGLQFYTIACRILTIDFPHMSILNSTMPDCLRRSLSEF